jgi:hypothetical protein
MKDRDGIPDHRLEEAWRAALRHEQAPEDFGARVLARLTDSEPATKRKPLLPFPVLQASTLANAWMRVALAAVLMLAFVLPAGYRLHRQAEIARGEAVRQQVMLALRITGTQLRSIQGRTQSIHIEPGILEGDSQ